MTTYSFDGATPKRIAGLDGLRALAVLGVVLYHLNLTALASGGFLGVDLFFAISGYLITTLLWEESLRNRPDFLRRFYFQRSRRLLPALAFTVLLCLACALTFAPDALHGLLAQIPSTFGASANLYQLTHKIAYFAQFERPDPLQHFWSLAIELQFYLAWPLLVRWAARNAKPWAGFVLSVALGLASAGLMATIAILQRIPFDAGPDRIYLGSDTHCFGLLLGASFAFLRQAMRRDGVTIALPSGFLGALGFAALVALLALFQFASEASPWLYRGGFVGVSLLAGAAIWGSHRGSGTLARLLDHPLLRWIGERSYSIYLLHWPIFCYLRPRYELPESPVLSSLIRVAVTLALAELTYRFIESPARRAGAVVAAPKSMLRNRVGVLFPILTGCFALCFALQTFHGRAPAPVVEVASAAAKTGPVEPVPPVAEIAAPAKPAELERVVVTGARRTATAKPKADPASSWPAPVAVPSAPATASAIATTAPAQSQALPPLADPAAPRPDTPATEAAVAIATPQATPPAPAAKAPSRAAHGYYAATDDILAIGDSVMLGASNALIAQVRNLKVDAVVGRQGSDALRLVIELKGKGELTPVVVLHLGTNGTLYPEQWDKLLDMLKDARRIVIVNDHAERRWAKGNNELIGKTASRTNVVVVDWDGLSSEHPEYFVKDGIHLTYPGIQAYNHAIVTALESQGIVAFQVASRETKPTH